MNYKILPTKDFERDFEKLDAYFQSMIKNKIEDVTENPARYKHMFGKFKGSCRVRIGKLRVVFSYNIEKQELYLEKIVFGHKY